MKSTPLGSHPAIVLEQIWRGVKKTVDEKGGEPRRPDEQRGEEKNGEREEANSGGERRGGKRSRHCEFGVAVGWPS